MCNDTVGLIFLVAFGIVYILAMVALVLGRGD